LNAPRTALLEEDVIDTAGTVDFANMAGVRLAGLSGVTYTSQNQSVVGVDAQGRITAVSSGNTTVTVSYLGQNDVVPFTVGRRQEGVANAGTNYVYLRAADFAVTPTQWTNRAGTGDFFAEGTPTFVANVENTGQPGVRFNGTEAFVGPLSN
jgi:hypothetical protein